jgi:hypothetical protein
MFRKVLRTATDYFHKQHYIICLSAALNGRQELKFCYQLIFIHAEIFYGSFWDSYFKFYVTRFYQYALRYTQVVWVDTYKVGCAYTGSSIFYPSIHNFYVCNCGPDGNYEDGSMYKIGTPCTACRTADPNCENGLCVWRSYVVCNKITCFRLVDWAPPCLPSLTPYNIPLILRTRKI